MSEEEQLDFMRFYNKHKYHFGEYYEAYYFAVGFFISRGYSWEVSTEMANELVDII